jgi:hypothetical protein
MHHRSIWMIGWRCMGNVLVCHMVGLSTETFSAVRIAHCRFSSKRYAVFRPQLQPLQSVLQWLTSLQFKNPEWLQPQSVATFKFWEYSTNIYVRYQHSSGPDKSKHPYHLYMRGFGMAVNLEKSFPDVGKVAISVAEAHECLFWKVGG